MTGSVIAGRSVRARTARPLRHGLAATALVLLVCGVVALLSCLSYRDTVARLNSLRANAIGSVVASSPGVVRIAWQLPSGVPAGATVSMSSPVPPAGTRTQIRYDPDAPGSAIIPGGALFAEVARAESGIVFPALIALLVLLIDAGQLLVLGFARRRPARTLPVRRVRIQRGLLCRSWLETETRPQQWIPVHYDPLLAELPAPAEVVVRGRRRCVVDYDGRRLYSAGRVTTTEPRGRRTDSPSTPDPAAARRAERHGPLRQLRVDAAFLVPAPLVGLLWTYLAGTAFPGWLAATLITAALALKYPTHRASDPT